MMAGISAVLLRFACSISRLAEKDRIKRILPELDSSISGRQRSLAAGHRNLWSDLFNNRSRS